MFPCRAAADEHPFLCPVESPKGLNFGLEASVIKKDRGAGQKI